MAFNDTIIGEIELNMAAKPVDFHANRFLRDLCKAGDVRKLKSIVLEKINYLAGKQLIYTSFNHQKNKDQLREKQ